MTALLSLLLCLLISIVAGIAANGYVNILTKPGQVLDFWAKWLYDLRDWYVGTTPMDFHEGDEGPEMAEYYAIRHQRADYVLKPLLTCVYCVAGQMGFWLSLYYKLWYNTNYTIISCLITAVIAVWLGGAFQAIQKKHFPL
ncbi:hypothetical protein GCM10028810_54360 [Spirosoma litoris]